jgi:hypothetical protein
MSMVENTVIDKWVYQQRFFRYVRFQSVKIFWILVVCIEMYSFVLPAIYIVKQHAKMLRAQIVNQQQIFIHK